MSTNKRAFNTIIPGQSYEVPEYAIQEGIGIVETGNTVLISFVRGSKQYNDPHQPELVKEHGPKAGTLHEHLLSVIIEDLKLKSSEVPSRETSLVITKLEEARHWLEERQKAREAAGVVGTYQPHKS